MKIAFFFIMFQRMKLGDAGFESLKQRHTHTRACAQSVANLTKWKESKISFSFASNCARVGRWQNKTPTHAHTSTFFMTWVMSQKCEV